MASSSASGEKIVKLAHDLPWDDDDGDDAAKLGANEANGESSNRKTIRKTADIRIDERGVSFDDFFLREPILKGLKKACYFRPSPIQLKAIPLGRCGLDLIVQSKSGTGKTCVFTVLALEMVESTNSACQALMIAPTREIALQNHQTLTTIGYFLTEKKENEFTGVKYQPGINIDCFIGGTALQVDQEKLKLKKCQIVVGTPGRILQLVSDGHLSLDAVRLFVLDEADKLMQESYVNDVNAIYAHLPSTKQLIVASATYPRQLEEFISRYMKTPTFVRLDQSNVQLLGVKQYVLMADFDRQTGLDAPGTAEFESWLDKKIDVLHKLFSRILFNQCLIFCNYQDKAEEVYRRLSLKYKWPTAHISASLSQKQRTSVLMRLKNCQIRILVATDIMARGIDAENVNLVINFDVPVDAETYFHRIGRAGRFGGYGATITLVMNRSEKQKFFLMAVQNAFQIKKIPDLKELPRNLVENEQFFCDLPKLDLPSVETLKLQSERGKNSKSKGQQDGNQSSTKAAPIGPDEYSTLIQLVGPVERWSPAEFAWEINEESRNALVNDGGQRRVYSRDSLLAILKESLERPGSPLDQAVEIPANGDDEHVYTRDSMLAILTENLSSLESPSAHIVEICQAKRDELVYSREDMLAILKENPPPLGRQGTPSAEIGEIDPAKPVEYVYSRESMLNILKENVPPLDVQEPLSTQVLSIRTTKPDDHVYCRETMMAILNETKSAIVSPTPPTSIVELYRVKPEERIYEYPREVMLAILNENLETLGRRETPPAQTVEVRRAKRKEKPKVVDVRNDYDEAIREVMQSPFHRFFGDCVLKLQALAVTARQGQPKLEKSTQTDDAGA